MVQLFWFQGKKKKPKCIGSGPQRDICYSHLHGDIIQNSLTMKATQMPINRQIDKQNMVYMCNGILFSLKKEILAYATTWMNIENIILGGIIQS